MEFVEKNGKTVNDAVELALIDLNVTRDRVDVDVIEEPSKGLFGIIGVRLAKVKVTLRNIDPIEEAEIFLSNVFQAMQITVMIEHISNHEGITLNLVGDDLGILIGKHGQTLDALQYLTNLAVNRKSFNKARIILDIEDYRKRRSDTLSRLAIRLADKVKRRGDKVVLEPMSPHERKIIHMALQQDKDISTYSEGEEPYRKIVIALKK